METFGTSLYNHSSYLEISYFNREALEVVTLKSSSRQAGPPSPLFFYILLEALAKIAEDKVTK